MANEPAGNTELDALWQVSGRGAQALCLKDRVLGLIYQPFADWVGQEYQITAQVAADLPVEVLTQAASPATPVIASVHKWVR